MSGSCAGACLTRTIQSPISSPDATMVGFYVVTFCGLLPRDVFLCFDLVAEAFSTENRFSSSSDPFQKPVVPFIHRHPCGCLFSCLLMGAWEGLTGLSRFVSLSVFFWLCFGYCLHSFPTIWLMYLLYINFCLGLLLEPPIFWSFESLYPFLIYLGKKTKQKQLCEWEPSLWHISKQA